MAFYSFEGLNWFHNGRVEAKAGRSFVPLSVEASIGVALLGATSMQNRKRKKKSQATYFPEPARERNITGSVPLRETTPTPDATFCGKRQ